MTVAKNATNDSPVDSYKRKFGQQVGFMQLTTNIQIIVSHKGGCRVYLY